MKAILRLRNKKSCAGRNLFEEALSIAERWSKEGKGKRVQVQGRIPIGPEVLPNSSDAVYLSGYKKLEKGGRMFTESGDYIAIIRENDNNILMFLDGERGRLTIPLSFDRLTFKGTDVLDEDNNILGRVFGYESGNTEMAPWVSNGTGIPAISPRRPTTRRGPLPNARRPKVVS